MFDTLKNPREPVNAYTHLFGMVLAFAGTLFLLQQAWAAGKNLHLAAFAVFGVSLIALYLASSLYHMLRVSDEKIRVLRRLDHIMIFVFIAGSYTPICLIALEKKWGTGLFIAIWSVTAIGIVVKIFWLHAPRWLSVAIYLLAGWLALVAIVPLYRALPFGGLAWTLAGGAFYTGGAILYARKWPNPLPGIIGFHEIWHVCVLAGSACHFYLMWRFVLPMP